jgi:ATP-dependent DNA helicase RecG
MTPLELLEQLNELDEHTRVEAKAAGELGKSALETICAFANEPGLGGGWLLLGATLEEGTLFRQYAATGPSRRGQD